jgi:hypothetical protein
VPGSLPPFGCPIRSKKESEISFALAKTFVRTLIAAKDRLSKFLLRHGRIFSETKNWSEKHWEWLRAQQFEGAAEVTTFEHYIVQVEHLEERRAALEKEIHALAQTEA